MSESPHIAQISCIYIPGWARPLPLIADVRVRSTKSKLEYWTLDLSSGSDLVTTYEQAISPLR
jgi:hypothetical protein